MQLKFLVDGPRLANAAKMAFLRRTFGACKWVDKACGQNCFNIWNDIPSRNLALWTPIHLWFANFEKCMEINQNFSSWFCKLSLECDVKHPVWEPKKGVKIWFSSCSNCISKAKWRLQVLAVDILYLTTYYHTSCFSPAVRLHNYIFYIIKLG